MEEVDGVWTQMHPLENPLILDVLFKCNLTSQDLNACRQVSKLWRRACLKKWRSSISTSVKILTESKMTAFLQFVDDPFNEFFTAPYIKYILGFINLPFWYHCGHQVQRLKLEGITFHSPLLFRTTVYTCFPNLIKLTLKNVKIGESKENIIYPNPDWMMETFPENRKLICLAIHLSVLGVCWMDLLNHFPCVELLSLEGLKFTDPGIFPALRKIRQEEPTKLRIKHVDTIQVPNLERIHGGLIRVLRDTTLNLESISLCINHDLEVGTVRRILSAHRFTLKRLSLDGRQTNLNSMEVFPPESMEALEELTLWMFTFLSLSYLRKIPNLRKFVVWGNHSYNQGDYDIAPEMSVPMVKCTQLTITHQGSNFLDRLINWLPNLERLAAVKLDNEGFELVCRRWPNLLRLELFESRVSESGLTGLDLIDVKLINGEGENSHWRPIAVPRANLSAFKRLQIFSLESVPFKTPMELGYCAAAYGIQQLPELRNLKFQNIKLTGQIWERLLAEFSWTCQKTVAFQVIS